MTNEDFSALLLRAINSPHGIIVACENVEGLKQKFYQLREKARKQSNFLFDSLTFRTSPTNPNSELWIERKA